MSNTYFPNDSAASIHAPIDLPLTRERALQYLFCQLHHLGARKASPSLGAAIAARQPIVTARVPAPYPLRIRCVSSIMRVRCSATGNHWTFSLHRLIRKHVIYFVGDVLRVILRFSIIKFVNIHVS